MPAAFKGTLTGNPAPTTWTATHAYTAGALVQPSSPTGQYFQCQENGSSGGSEPAWSTPASLPVPGTIYVDGSTQWFCMGSFVAVDGSGGPNIVVDIPIDTDSATTPVIARALKNLANYVNAFVALVHTWTVEQFFAPTSGNTNAIQATGHGNGTGVKAYGGSSAGLGVDAYGGAGQAAGQFLGGANSYALVAIGGSGTGGQGIIAQGTSDNEGGNFTGDGTAPGGVFTGGTTAGAGLRALGGSGSGGGIGIIGTGGGSSAPGGSFTGSGASAGVVGTSAGTGDGGAFTGGATGNGITATAGGTSGSGVNASGGSTGRGVLSESSSATLPSITAQNTSSGPGLVAESVSGPSLVVNGNVTRGMIAATNPQGSDPSTPVEGDMYYNNTTHTWRFYNGSIWGTV